MSIAETLRSVATQRVSSNVRFRVIVADNDTAPTAKALVEATARECEIEVLYLHAPACNISVARNACLAAAEAPLVAFLDDDEFAAPTWLQAMLDALDASKADVLFGPVTALYGADAPEWLRRADLHSTRPAFRAGGRIDTGYTCNVLFRMAAVGDRRFDLALGRSGGEDTDFFSRLHRAGAELRFCPMAVVFERVAEHRANLRWLTTRAFRSGQSHSRTLSGQPGPRANRFVAVAVAGSKMLYCLVGTGARLGSPVGWRKGFVRAALHAGVVARLLGKRDIQLY